jgi:ferredoxin-NADP reductase
VEGATLPGRLNWRVGTIADVIPETARVHSLVIDCPDWPGHLAGQHVDVRLTAEDGYQAQRSYTIASSPEDDRLMLTVERLEEGEVSPYLFDVLQTGDSLEFRGPIGGYFVWQASLGGPLMLIAGGSGVVPLRAMLRHRAAMQSGTPTRLLYSARSMSEVIYRDELTRLAGNEDVDVAFTLTRDWPGDWTGFRRRIDVELFREIVWPPGDRPLVYICGPTAFVDTAASVLVQLGHDPARIRTERFGPTG